MLSTSLRGILRKAKTKYKEIKFAKYQIPFGEFCKIIGADIPAEFDAEKIITRVISQSEYTQPGEIVFASRYYNVEKTVKMALEKGAFAVLCPHSEADKYKLAQSDPNDPRSKYADRVIGVDDPLECIARYELWRKKDCKAKVYTVTGSVGKTTTTGLLNSIMTRHFKTLIHHSMSNSHGAILRNVQQLTSEHQVWVQEVGGVQPGYVESSARILTPDALILTNISVSHLNTYKSKENIFYDKSSLERYMKPDGVVIVNYDDEMLRNAKFTHKVISFGIESEDVDYRAENITSDITGICFDLVCSEGRFPVKLYLHGEYNALNAIAAIALGRHAGVSMKDAIADVAEYRPAGIRQNFVDVGGYTMLVDCFNAEPDTVFGTAKTLSSIPRKDGGKRIFVTGHIDKIGSTSKQMHADLGRRLAELDGIDDMVFFAGDSKYSYEAAVKAGAKNVHLMGSRQELEKWMRDNITTRDITAYKSGQFEAALAISIDNVYGTVFQNNAQYNGGAVEKEGDYLFRIRREITESEGYEGDSAEIVIPDKYKDVTLTRVGNSAFAESKITSVVIPDAIRNIGIAAFCLCENLKEVRLPARLQIIERNAFLCCHSLEEIKIPEGTIHIDKQAFRDCRKLACIEIPGSVGFIDKDAFYGCPSVVIKCPEGSYAQQYAKQNNISYTYC